MRLSFKKYVRNYLLTALIIFGLLQTVFLSHKLLTTNELELYIYAKRLWVRGKLADQKIRCPAGKTKILVFGDSTTASSFRPVIFDTMPGGETFTVNLSLVGHDITRYSFILKEFIRSNYIPDYIILNPSYKREEKRSLNGSTEEIIYIFTHGTHLNFSILIDHFLPALSSPKIDAFIANTFTGVETFKKNATLKINEMVSERGTYYWLPQYFSIGKNFTHPKDTPDEVFALPELESDYMGEIYNFLDFAAHLGIKVFIISAPRRYGSAQMYSEKPLFYSTLEKRYPNVSMATPWESYWYPSEFFFDRGHLNFYGAELFTTDVFNDFQKTYGEQVEPRELYNF